MTKKWPLYIESILLFILLPVSFLWAYPFYLKVLVAVAAFVYVLIVLFRVEKPKRTSISRTEWISWVKRTTIVFGCICVASIFYVYTFAPAQLFYVPIHKTKLYVLILGVYTVLSVWPQEIVYRTFFITRYRLLFSNNTQRIFINALVFACAHLFLRNLLVLIITFVGGLLFAYTYIKKPSTLLVSIEHALYGNWLFTVGLGNMLAFPGIEAG